MRVVHLSTSDHGGAAKAALRIHASLAADGVDSTMLVALKSGATSGARPVRDGFAGRLWNQLWPRLNALALKRYRLAPGRLFSPAIFTFGGLERHPDVRKADVLCLYWVAGLLSPEAIGRLRAPLVWRLSDEWPFTGGCHYAGDCERFTTRCGRCPVLTSHHDGDLSRRGIDTRLSAWRNSEIVVVAPSRWMATRAARSAVFQGRRIEVIPTGVDLDIFKPIDRPIDRLAARRELGLPGAKRIIVFGAHAALSDHRKGWPDLRACLQGMSLVERTEYCLVIFGAREQPALEVGMRVAVLGEIEDPARLAKVYAVADVVVVPSRHENLPQVAIEAIACGTPVVAFDVGGIPDAVVHAETGWLAPPGDIANLAQGIRWVFDRGTGLRTAARRHAEAIFSDDLQTSRFLHLLREIVASA